MAYPDKINALVDVTADQTLAAGGHAARHNDVNEALEEVRDVLGGGQPITATANYAVDIQRNGFVGTRLNRYSNDTGQVSIVMRKARGSIASPSSVQSGDTAGTLAWVGYSAAAGDFITFARIDGLIDGVPDSAGDTTDMPGRLTFSTTPDGSNLAAERMRINNAGAVMIGTTTPGSAGAGDLVVNGGVFLGGSAAANELDDYEEGTWTPAYAPSSGSFASITYDAQTTGTYIKIGKLVIAHFRIMTDSFSIGTASGFLEITGLPFTVAAGVHNRSSANPWEIENFNSTVVDVYALSSTANSRLTSDATASLVSPSALSTAANANVISGCFIYNQA